MTTAKKAPPRKTLQAVPNDAILSTPLFTSLVVAFVPDLTNAEDVLQRKAETLLGPSAKRESQIEVSRWESVGGIKMRVEARFVGLA